MAAFAICRVVAIESEIFVVVKGGWRPGIDAMTFAAIAIDPSM
jgi:hypothetical protein